MDMSEKEMKEMKMDVAFGSKEKGNLWELKGVVYEVPANIDGWVKWLGEEKVLLTLETYDAIRRQDAARRAHVGGKNTRGFSDQKIRDEVVPNFKLFEKTRISAERRPPTKEEAFATILALPEAERARAIQELLASVK